MKTLRYFLLLAVIALPGLTMFTGSATAADSFNLDIPQQGVISPMEVLTAFHLGIFNTGDSGDTYIVTIEKEKPANWFISICANGTCYDPVITTVEVPISNGRSKVVDVDFTTYLDQGAAWCRLTVTSSNNSSLSESVKFTVISNGLDLLVVDGDNNADYETYYNAAIAPLGKSSAVWNRQEMGALTGEELGNFEYVVWEAGTFMPGLDNNDRTAITYYIQHGGGLFLSGQNLAYEAFDAASPYQNSGTQSWFNLILGTDYISRDAGTSSVVGTAADVVSSGMAFNINGGDGADNNDYPNVISTYGTANQSLKYSTDQTASVKSSYGDGRSYFCGFGFEGIDSSAARSALMTNILGWLDGSITPVSDETPQIIATAPAVAPNPFNPQTTISCDIGGTKPVNSAVTVYDLTGRAVRKLFTGTVSPGAQSWTWNGRDDVGRNLATGIYLARIQVADQFLTVKMTLTK